MINPLREKHISSKYLKSVGNFNQLSEIGQLELLKYAFERRASVRMTVYGNSMVPFICSGDVITLRPVDRKSPQIGEIVAFEQAEGKKLIVHRIIHQDHAGYEMKGDNCTYSDGKVSSIHLLGTVTRIERKSRPANIGISKVKRWIAWLSRKNILQRFQIFLQHPIKLSIVLLGRLWHFIFSVE